jgi:hypothetical protein
VGTKSSERGSRTRTRAAWIAVLAALALVVAAVAWRIAGPVGGDDSTADVARTEGSALPGLPREHSNRRSTIALGPRQPVLLDGSENVDIDPSVIGSIDGRVISSGSGEGVAGADLSFWGPSGDVTVQSGAGGAFRLEPTQEGLYELMTADAPGYFPLSVEDGDSPVLFAARKGSAMRGVTIVVIPAVEYMGRVLTEGGDPVAGAAIEILGARAHAGQAEWSSDERGEFTFHARDGAILEARHEEHGRGRAHVGFAVQASHRLTIVVGSVEAPREAEITGRVVDRDGAPLSDVLVSAVFEPPRARKETRNLAPGASERTDGDGRFTLRRLDAGFYSVMASTPEYAPTVVEEVAAPTAGLEIVLDAGARITGRVTETVSGSPVSSFVVIVSERRGPLETRVLLAESVHDPKGEYATQEVAAGSYLVTISAARYALSETRSVTVASESVVADFALDRGGRISGTVTDATSKAPLADAKVSLEHRLGLAGPSLPLVANAVTDAAGAFLLEGVGTGAQSLLATAVAHHGRVVSGITVPAGGDVGPIEIPLTPTEPGEVPKIELAGIGVVLAADRDALVIQRLIEGGGAAEAGLEVGDEIVAVAGELVIALGFHGSTERIRGPEGTVVELAVRRGGPDGAEQIVGVVRRKIKS